MGGGSLDPQEPPCRFATVLQEIIFAIPKTFQNSIPQKLEGVRIIIRIMKMKAGL